MSVYNPHCDNHTLNKEYKAYRALAIGIANKIIVRTSGPSQYLITYNSVLIKDAALIGLSKAARNWNPNQASCEHECILKHDEDKCVHDGQRVTLGAYARQYIYGEIFAFIRRELKHHNTLPLVRDELDEYYAEFANSQGFRGDLIGFYQTYFHCSAIADGSHGTERDDWAPLDLKRLVHVIKKNIYEKKIRVRGMNPDQVWYMVQCISQGMSFHETASEVSSRYKIVCRDKMVARLLETIRQRFQDMDYAKHKEKYDYVELPEVVRIIIKRFHPKGLDETSRESMAKRVGAWASDGKIPATKGPNKRWRFSEYGVKATLEKWRIHAAKVGRKCPAPCGQK